MAELPSLSAQKVLRAFKKLGFTEVRRTGSHAIMKKDGVRNLINIPVHPGKDVKKGLLKKQIENAGITVAEFLKNV